MQQELLVRRVLKDLKVQKVILGQLDHRGQKVIPVILALKAQLVLHMKY